jgi:hypothetical protein
VSVSSRYGAVTTPLTLGDYELDPDTGLVRVAGGDRFCGTYTVTYTAGRPTLPAAIRLAVLVIAEHLWETQRRPGFTSDAPLASAARTASLTRRPGRHGLRDPEPGAGAAPAVHAAGDRMIGVTATAVDALRDAIRAALPTAGRRRDGVAVFDGPAPERAYAARAVTVAAAFQDDQDAVEVSAWSPAPGPTVTETLTVACSVYAGGGNVDVDGYRGEAGTILTAIEDALRADRTLGHGGAGPAGVGAVAAGPGLEGHRGVDRVHHRTGVAAMSRVRAPAALPARPGPAPHGACGSPPLGKAFRDAGQPMLADARSRASWSTRIPAAISVPERDRRR